MKIAVTGGSGFIGSRVVKKLLETGHEVINIDINHSENKDVETRICDITSYEQIKMVLKGVDAVYHFAGLVLDGVRKNPSKGVQLNVDGTLNVLEACRANNIKKILFASTFYVYDGLSEKMIVNEETPLNILNMEIFGATKLMGETMIKEYSRKYGLEHVIFRLGSAYGTGNCTCVVKTFIEAALKSEPIEIWGEGKRRNQYTYVEDIAEGCILGFGEVNETFNLISPEETSTGDLAELLKRKYGFEAIFETTKKEGASMPYMDSRKSIKKLGWAPVNLEEGVERTVEEIKNSAG